MTQSNTIKLPPHLQELVKKLKEKGITHIQVKTNDHQIKEIDCDYIFNRTAKFEEFMK